jgi:hypothetical protein
MVLPPMKLFPQSRLGIGHQLAQPRVAPKPGEGGCGFSRINIHRQKTIKPWLTRWKA